MISKNLSKLLVLNSALFIPLIAVDVANAPVQSLSNLSSNSSSSSYKMGAEEGTTYKVLKNKIEKKEVIDVNKALIDAVKHGYQRLVEYLLNLPAGLSRPNQATIDEALQIARATNNPQMIGCIEGSSALEKSDKTVVNTAQKSSVIKKDQGTVVSSSGSSPGKTSANDLLDRMVEKNDYRMVEFLLNQKEASLRPDQISVNKAFKSAVYKKNQGMVEYLLNRPLGSLRPDPATIDEALQIARVTNNPEMIGCIENFLGRQVLPNVVSKTSEASRVRSLAPIMPYLPSSYVIGDQEKAELVNIQKKSYVNLDDYGRDIKYSNINEYRGHPEYYYRMDVSEAAEKGYMAIIAWMLSETILGKKCKQWELDYERYKKFFSNKVFRRAADHNQQATMAWMLSLPEGQGSPDQLTIISAYRSAISRNNDLANFLRPYALQEDPSKPRGY